MLIYYTCYRDILTNIALFHFLAYPVLGRCLSYVIGDPVQSGSCIS